MRITGFFYIIDNLDIKPTEDIPKLEYRKNVLIHSYFLI
jgi:hypothetical protein